MIDIREQISLWKIRKMIKNFHKLKSCIRNRKIVYVDMDGVLVDFQSGIDQLDSTTLEQYKGQLDNVPNIFSTMKPIDGAIDAFKKLTSKYDVYLLSTSPWDNPSAWRDKVVWVQKNLGTYGYKRLILSHNKNLNKGDYLIDDRPKSNGAKYFDGKVIHFGSRRFPDWDAVLKYLL